jgi:transmembrane sensor
MKNIMSLLENVHISKKVEDRIESLKPLILRDVHDQIDEYEVRNKLHRYKMRKLLVAASFTVVIALSALIAYQAGLFEHQYKITKVSCPFGKKISLTLPDGSKVFLNSGTTIAYSSSYGTAIRRIAINGEAFFDVSHDEKVPFVVSCCGKMQVKVLGTKFNVEAYDEDAAARVTLMKGKVSLALQKSAPKMILSPNEQAIYDKNTRCLTKKKVNVSDVMAWERNEMFFNDMPLMEIAKKLERCYNVQITITSEVLKRSRYNGAFSPYDNCNTILSFLATMDTRLEIEKHGNRVVISQSY